MSNYGMGLGVGLCLGLAIGLPHSSEKRAIDAFNAGAVGQTEDGQLCLHDIHKDTKPVVACVPYVIDAPE